MYIYAFMYICILYVTGSDGVPNSGKTKDACNVCDGDGSSCAGIHVNMCECIYIHVYIYAIFHYAVFHYSSGKRTFEYMICKLKCICNV